MPKFVPQDYTDAEKKFLKSLENYINKSKFCAVDKFNNFTKYTTRQALTKFLCKNEIFKKIIKVEGSIIECGVLFGGGLMTWAQLSSIYEPTNHSRKIIGFDSFKGFAKLSEKDRKSKSVHAKKGGLRVDSYKDLQEAIKLFDQNRFIGHIPKIILVKGDANKTILQYLNENPHTVVSLLYLDFDVYQPTKKALEKFLPLMPKGAVIAFDELNNPHWPGETQALLDTAGIRHYKIQRFSFSSYISYVVLK